MAYTIDSRARAAFFDIDGTLTTGGEAWEPLLKSPDVPFLRKRWTFVSGVPHYLLSKTGLVSQAGFRDRWVRLMAWQMTGWREEQVHALCARIVEDHLAAHLRPDVVDILHQHTAAGQPVLLVSTMFEEIVSGLAHRLGADAGLGSRLELRDGRCTGKIIGPTCSGERKIDFARHYLAEHFPAVSLADSAAYADSQSDAPLLSSVGYPVAVYPDEALQALAAGRGWRIYAGT